MKISKSSGDRKQKKSLSGWHTCTVGICAEARKSWRSEAVLTGAGAGLQARSLRSAEPGIDKQFLVNRSGTRSERLQNG